MNDQIVALLEELIRLQAVRVAAITAEEWCARTGDTIEAIYSRRKRGVWRDGVECSKPRGGGLWVNVAAATTWARTPDVKSESPKVSLSGVTTLGNRSGSESPSCSAASSAANDSTLSPPSRTSDMQ